jgi:wobble nucleotide-excising tRNase
MIKRVKQIKNIGTFSDFLNGSSVQFEKLTFIYGLNTFGKTTLADVFSSLKFNDNSLINSRKTIPAINSAQKVVFSYKKEDREQDITFENNTWVENELAQNLEIFGTDFIHKNLFTGLSVERSNKENFTQFILGQDGVALANLIKTDKSNLSSKNRGLSNLIPLFAKGKSQADIQSFLNTSIEGLDRAELKSQILALKNTIQEEEKRLTEPTKISNMESIAEFDIPQFDILNIVSRASVILQREYSEIREEVLQKLESHIENTFKSSDGAENWVQKGLNYKKEETDDCVFCGQSLTNARELLDAYDSYFNKEYKSFIEDVSTELTSVLEALGRENFNCKNLLNTIPTILIKYKELIQKDEFNTLSEAFERELITLNEEEVDNKKEEFEQAVIKAISEKNKKPFQPIKVINTNQLGESFKGYFTTLERLKSIISRAIVQISTFKKQYEKTTQIQERIQTKKDNLLALETKLNRLLQSNECQAYVNEIRSINQLKAQIETNDSLLETQQNEYLTSCFQRINELFVKFGSHNFTLEKETNNRGHQPVYSLKVKFQNVEIEENKLSKVFSESDRRALALAVFWSKIELKPQEEKGKTVIVLDDPITSFDENRITQSIGLFKETLNEVRQIIILTHYPHFIKNFCERSMNDDFTPAFLNICKNENSSYLERVDKKEFTISKYEEVFTRINTYIERVHNNSIKSDLRPFLESQFIPIFFVNELKIAESNGLPLGSLSDQIDAIFTDEEVKIKFHFFRTSLNPDSHIFTSSNNEDVRNFAREMMNYLYSFSFN